MTQRIVAALLISASMLGCGVERTSIGAYLPPPSATGQYLEAEDGDLRGGFVSQDDATASGGACLAPPDGTTSDDVPGSARATYQFDAPRSATYLIWGRIRAPDAEHNRFWFQLDGGTWTKWRISTGAIWFWDAFHDDVDYGDPIPFAIAAGSHTLVIANCVDGVQLDRLYISADGDEPIGNDTPCNPPHSIQVGDACVPSCGSHGATTCGADACSGQQPLAAYDCDVCCFAP
ncbi:MAG TPA: hypothetical protein VGI70_13485 [Polyangiales bacterium]